MDVPIQRRGNFEIKVGGWHALQQHLLVARWQNMIAAQLGADEPVAQGEHAAEEGTVENVLRDIKRAPTTSVQRVEWLGGVLLQPQLGGVENAAASSDGNAEILLSHVRKNVAQDSR